MNKVAIVVQRCHESIAGGSEYLAWHYATLLREQYEVDVLTTTALDIAEWANVLPEGSEEKDGVNIIRFPVTVGRSEYWSQLHKRLLGGFNPFARGRRRNPDRPLRLPWSVPLQEQFILNQGPYSEPLIQFIRQRWPDYRAIIFVTYLYPTSYFGLQQAPQGHAVFVPTLHDEQPAYLSAYKHAAHRARELIWLTAAERRVGHKLWGELPGRIVAMAVDTKPRQPANDSGPYLLYCGRVDPNKGCAQLFEFFFKFKRETLSNLRLVLTGKDDMEIPPHPHVDFRGFVSTEEKFRLMAGATAYVMPSPNESFSIVTLEAMAQQTPVLACGASEVLVDHVSQSGAGRIYCDYESFTARLKEMLANDNLRAQMGAAGRAYVMANYQREYIRDRLVEVVESCAEAPPARSIKPPIETAKAEKIAARPNSSNLLNSPPLPLPPGWSEENLRRFVSSVQVEDGRIEELKIYAETDFKRFVYTLGLVPEKSGQKILELGANPYFITTLLHKFRDADLHLANFNVNATQGKQEVTINQTGETIEYSFKEFNIETETFPYEDSFFDIVLFCEIIEHLLSDPVHALTEIRRVLKPGGELILTTPNVARLENVRKIIAGENVYDPYSGHGPYGRHNREYTQEDIFSLLSSNGFEVRTIFTADVHPEPDSSRLALRSIPHRAKRQQTDLGQYVFCRCDINHGSKETSPVRPEWLFRGTHENEPAKS